MMVVMGDQPKEYTLPDDERVSNSKLTQAKLKEHLRIYSTTQERLHHNIKRLDLDVQQVVTTLGNIRECAKTLETMEGQFMLQFNL
jgi:hypothetical protein